MSIFQNISVQNVPFDGLVTQPMQVGPQNYQYMLQQNVQCHPQIKGALADIAAYIHNMIAQKATTNLARAVHFNMIMIQNNPEMFILTSLVANMVYFRMTNGQYNDFNTAVTQVAEWAVTRRVNFITVNVPDLINNMQSQSGHIQQFANEYVAEAQSVMQQISETYMGGTSGFNNGNQQQRGNGNGMSGGFGGQPASGFGSGNNNSGMSAGFGGGGAATGFGMGNNNGRRGGNVIVRSSDANAPSGDRFNDDLLGAIPAFQPPTPKKEAEVSQVVKETPKAEERPSSLLDQMNNGLAGVIKQDEPVGEKPLVDEKGNLIIPNLPTTNAKWQASRHQLQPLLWDKRRYAINRRGFMLEGTNYVIDTLKKVPMDRAAHSLPPTVDFLSKVTPAEKTREEFREKTLIDGASIISVVRNIDVEAEYVERVNELRECGHMVFGGDGMSSIEEAMSMSRQAAMLCSNSEIGAYTTEFMIAKEFTVFKDDAAALRDLGKQRTIGALVDEMRAIIQDPHASHALRVAVVQLNSYLAESWMEWIRFYLCLDEFDGSDSFIDDVQAMRDDIGTIAGIPYRRLIDVNQQRFIQTYLAFGAEHESDLEETLKEAGAEDKGRNVVVVPILTPSMMVCTEFLDSEFAFSSSAELDGRDIACCFSEESTSAGFRNLVQTMIERPRSIGLQAQIRRFYITTLDNVLYEVNMGLDEKAPPMLIKKIKRV